VTSIFCIGTALQRRRIRKYIERRDGVRREESGVRYAH